MLNKSKKNNKYFDESISQKTKDELRDKAGDAIDYVIAEAGKAASDPVNYVKSTHDNIASYTREQPFKALAIAASIGFVYGALRQMGRS